MARVPTPIKSDLPGWKAELVPPPSAHLLPASERYRTNYDAIFRKEPETAHSKHIDPEEAAIIAAQKLAAEDEMRGYWDVD